MTWLYRSFVGRGKLVSAPARRLATPNLDELMEEERVRRAVRKAVATCLTCGGKYRPAGGPCHHEFPGSLPRPSYGERCGLCGMDWRPGHTCLTAQRRYTHDPAL